MATTRIDEAETLLAGSPLCKGARREAVAGLAREAHFHDKLRGELLFGEQQSAEALYLVVRGCFKVLRPLAGGREVIVDLAGPHDIVGEACLAGDDPRHSNRAVAVHPSTVLALARPALLGFLEREPAALRSALSVLHASVVRAERRIEDMAVFGVRHRIVRLLFRLAEWTGREQAGETTIPVALTRQEIAELTGTTLETAIRVMSALRHKEVVVPARRGFVIRDRAALEAFAERAA